MCVWCVFAEKNEMREKKKNTNKKRVGSLVLEGSGVVHDRTLDAQNGQAIL